MSNYLLLDLIALLPPLLLSFDKKVAFYRNWKFLFMAILPSGIFFIGWDIIFTRLAVWGFNSEQVLGIWIYGLPLEEILFFIVVPYASVFTYEVIYKYRKIEFPTKLHRGISLFLILLLIPVAVVFHAMLYTFYVSVISVIMLFLLEFVLQVQWMKRFYPAFLLILLPFILMNGMLTSSLMGSVIVWYNPNHISGYRLFTIPVEDIFYGLSLLLMVISVYEFLKSRLKGEIKICEFEI